MAAMAVVAVVVVAAAVAVWLRDRGDMTFGPEVKEHLGPGARSGTVADGALGRARNRAMRFYWF